MKKNLLPLLFLLITSCNQQSIKTNTHYYSKKPIGFFAIPNQFIYFINDSLFTIEYHQVTSVVATYGNYSINNDTILLCSDNSIVRNNPLYFYEDSLVIICLDRNRIIHKTDTLYKNRRKRFGYFKSYPHKSQY